MRERTGAAASVARRRRERLARAGRACRGDTRAASQDFERAHTIIWRKYTLNDGITIAIPHCMLCPAFTVHAVDVDVDV